MPAIVPTITTDKPEIYTTNLQEFSKFSKRIHIDASDGTLAPTQLLPLSQIQPVGEGITLDIHVMSARPSEHLADVLRIKPSLCIIHAEVDDNIQDLFAKLKAAGIKVGVALLKTTFPKHVQERIAMSDHVMIFAGELGSQGGALDSLQMEKVPLVRAIKQDLEIGWDGGVNLSNIRAVAHSGVDVINVGSAITNAPDKAAMYQSLLAESEKKGVLI